MYLQFAALLLLLNAAASAEPAAQRDAFSLRLGSVRAAVLDLTGRYPDAYPRGREFLERLDAFEQHAENRPLSAGDRRRFEALEREALLANPLVSGQPLLFVARRQYKPDHHNTATLFQVGEINTASFEGGSALRVLDPAREGATITLLEAAEGVIRDPVVHFDGKRILFSMRRNIDDFYHLYEINGDGSGLRQLTFAEGVSDFDPLYLPCGDIVFSSTREPKYCMCNRHIMGNLFRMTGDGANIHQIGKSTLFEGHGTLMPDGRILYYRWEYVDRNFGDAQGLWTVRPDGTNHAVYWGNNTQSPGAVIDGRPVPGTQQALCVFSSCHDRPWGALALVDRRLGVDGAEDGQRSPSVIRTWPEDAMDLVGEGDPARFHWDTFMQVSPKYEDPFPLDATYFLCARTLGEGEKTGVYLLDLFGNELLIHAEEEGSPLGCFDPMPLAHSERPPILPDIRDFHAETGHFYVANVYEGAYLDGVPNGTVKYLRVVASPEKRTYTQPFWDGQGQQAPAMAWHDFNNKRILGIVPVEPDGSAYFSAPADTFLYFQLLDERGMMIQSMRSGTMIQPGETQGCVGCHENRLSAPPLANAPTVAALNRPPDALAGWRGATRNFSYMREVQPVFDRHCVRCHDYGGEAVETLNLAGDRDLVFNTSYNELWRRGLISVVGAGPAQVQPAYSWGAHASKLTEVLLEPHQDVELDAESIDRVIAWMDVNAPYYPEYDSAYPNNPGGRSPLTHAQVQRLAELTGAPLMNQLAFHANEGPQITFERPEHSPCLAGLAESDPEAHAEALDIIRAGAGQLAARSRADMPGFIPAPEHQGPLDKYRNRQRDEAAFRAAIRRDGRRFDERK